MFPNFERCRPSNEISYQKLFVNHLDTLQKQFSLYFKNADVLKLQWVRSPSAANSISGLTTREQEQLTNFLGFGCLWKNDYSRLSDKAVKVFISFCDDIFVRN
jgi:hypothetical protein